MNVLPANAIKKHGVSVIEKHLQYGPVHVLKHNHPVFVVITEQEYQLLLKKTTQSGLFSMLDKPAGVRSKKEIDAQIAQEHDSWE